MLRGQKKKRTIVIDNVRFEFTRDANDANEALPDEIGEIDVEYTALMCTDLMGCANVVHDSLTLEHLRAVLASENGSERYKGATLTTDAVGDGSDMIQYTEKRDTIYVRARKNPSNTGEWTLKRA